MILLGCRDAALFAEAFVSVPGRAAALPRDSWAAAAASDRLRHMRLGRVVARASVLLSMVGVACSGDDSPTTPSCDSWEELKDGVCVLRGGSGGTAPDTGDGGTGPSGAGT